MFDVGFTDNGGVEDLGMSLEHFLHFTRHDLLPIVDDDFLDPAGNGQVALAIEIAQIARSKPTICRKRRLVFFRAVVIAGHDIWTVNLDLSFLAGLSKGTV